MKGGERQCRNSSTTMEGADMVTDERCEFRSALCARCSKSIGRERFGDGGVADSWAVQESLLDRIAEMVFPGNELLTRELLLMPLASRAAEALRAKGGRWLGKPATPRECQRCVRKRPGMLRNAGAQKRRRAVSV